jgi:hypothetical protein
MVNPLFTILSGRFLYENYKQAIHVIEESEKVLSRLESSQSIDRKDFPGFIESERAYLEQIPQETPEETTELDYFEILLKVQQAE